MIRGEVFWSLTLLASSICLKIESSDVFRAAAYGVTPAAPVTADCDGCPALIDSPPDERICCRSPVSLPPRPELCWLFNDYWCCEELAWLKDAAEALSRL